MKKVILLAPLPPPAGGIAIWTQRMVQIKDEKWSFDVVDEKIIGKREFFGDKKKHNWLLEIKRCFTIWRNLRKKLKDKSTEIVHSCIPANTLPIIRELICCSIAKSKKKKFIVHFRCTIPNMVKGRINTYFFKKICKKADGVFVLNSLSKSFVLEKTKCREVFLIPNFVNDDEIDDQHNIRKKIEKVVYVGGVIKSKGCLDIVAIARERPDITFTFVGNCSKEVTDCSEGLKNVIFVGPQDKKATHSFLAESDIFMFLSFFGGEGFSNALLEAMACGLPCIVTPWAANEEMIGNGGGIVVPINNPREGLNALKKLESEDLRRSCASNNISKVKKEYIESVVVKQYFNAYEKISK